MASPIWSYQITSRELTSVLNQRQILVFSRKLTKWSKALSKSLIAKNSKLKLRLLFSSFFLVLVTTNAQAADLAQVYSDAKTGDPVVGASRANFKAIRENVPQARSRILPSVNAGASTQKSEIDFPGAIDSNPFSPNFGNPIPGENFNENGWNAQIRQSIINVSSWASLKSAQSSVKAAEYELRQIEQELIVRVVRAYMNVLRAQDFLDTSNAEVTAVNRQLEQVQQRFDVGLVAITDVLESQAAYDNALVRKIQADGDQGIFFQTLGTLTGKTYESLHRISESLPIINPNPHQEAEWVKTAQEENLGILNANEQLIAARRNMRAKRSEHLPTVDGIINKSHTISGGRNFFGSDTTDYTSFGLQLSLPIYNGGLTRSRVKQAAAQADQANELLNNRRLTVIRDTRNLYRAVATDVVRVKARLKAIKSSTSALEAVETGYEVGTRNVVDVLQAQQRLFASQFDYADSRYNYILNLMALKRAAGTLSADDLMELNQFTDPNDQVFRRVSLDRGIEYSPFQ